MSNGNGALVAPPPTADPASVPVTPAQLAWLDAQVAAWRAEGIVDETAAAAIVGRYRPTHRFGLARLLLGLGAAFVGVGLIWLVAANLDQLSPTFRFGAVSVVWLALLSGAEVLAGRRAHRGHIPSPVVGAARTLAALAFGAVVFQAAQSLQVPAFDPVLLGCWALGALLHAYAVRGRGPLLVGLGAGVLWVVLQAFADTGSPFAFVVALLGAGVLATGVAVVHERVLPEFAAPWREVGAALLLAGLFAAAVPSVTTEDFAWSPALVGTLLAGGLAAAGATLLGRGRSRAEAAVAVGVLIAGVLLVWWDAGADPAQVGALDWLHAAASVTAYVVVAGWVAALGILHDSWRLTAVALASVVLFTTFQAFAVFAAIIDGAWLFVVLGLILLGTGVLFDRARRELAATLDGVSR